MTTYVTTFTADGSGNSISFLPQGQGAIHVDNVSLKLLQTPSVDSNLPVKEFLSGNTDDGQAIIFRADTQPLSLLPEFENFANPLAIMTKLQRGSLVKCFVALGDGDFYELEGSATKGVSLTKVHAQNKGTMVTPPTARDIRISWRDSSMQLCRLTQGAIIFLPTNMNYVE